MFTLDQVVPWGRSYIDTIVDDLHNSGYAVSIEDVPYEFQRGGNQMMRIRRERLT